MIKIGICMMAVLLITGCVSGPKTIPFSSENSEALNIANQTDLVKKGSKLRDFTPDEISEAKASLEKSTGSAPQAMGVLKILTGDWMGALDIAGGAVAGMSMDNHISGYNRWIIAIDAERKDYTKIKRVAYQVIINATKKLLEEKGNIFHRVELSKTRPSRWGSEIPGVTSFTINDASDRIFGLSGADKSVNSSEVTEIGSGEQYIEFGKKLTLHGGYISPISFVRGDVKGYNGEKGYNQFLLDLTERLPSGIYFYVPSFQKVRQTTLKKGYEWGCDDFLCKPVVIYRTKKTAPSIYTQGHRLDFIKPLKS